jgi:hypothetical protein
MSYVKKHWFDILVGLISLGLATYYICTANIDTGIIWLISACIWLGMSRIDYNHERIEELELKGKKYDALADEVKAMRELQQTYEKLNEQRFKNLEGKNESSRTLHS